MRAVFPEQKIFKLDPKERGLSGEGVALSKRGSTCIQGLVVLKSQEKGQWGGDVGTVESFSDEAGAVDRSQIMPNLVGHMQDFVLCPTSTMKNLKSDRITIPQPWISLINTKYFNLSFLTSTGHKKWLEYFRMWRRGKLEDLAIFIKYVAEAPFYNKQHGEGGNSKKMGMLVPVENIT